MFTNLTNGVTTMETIKSFAQKYEVTPKKSQLDNGDWSLYFNSHKVGICIILDQISNPFTEETSYEISFTTCQSFKEGICDFKSQNTKRTPMRVRGYLLDFLSALRHDRMFSFIRDLKFDAESKRLNIYIKALDKSFNVSKKSYKGEKDCWTISL